MVSARTIVAWAGCGLLVVAAARGQDAEPKRFEFRETHMGSEFKLLLYCASEAEARSASRRAFDRIAELNRAYSDYDPESELMRLCDRAGGPPVAVSRDLFDILERSEAIWKASGGAFDVTIGPVGRLWRRARRDGKLPDRVHLDAAMAKVGFQHVRLDREQRTVQLLLAGMKLDLGGIAKGHASQAAIDVLKEMGHPRALMAGAGDIVVGDPPPGADGWRIGIASIEDPGDTPARYLVLSNRAVSTAGDAERFVEIDGVRYSHIVDPKSGLGIVRRGAVTVVALDGATADATDTAAYLLGVPRGLELIEATAGTAAIFTIESDGKETILRSKRWSELREEPAETRSSPGRG